MRKSILLALSLLGAFISSYLWWVYTSPSHPLVCLGTGCDVVRASRYANLWGLPMPVYGVAMYAVLAILLFGEALVGAPLARLTRYALAAISGAGFVFSLYLTWLEGFVIHAWCAWCVTSAITITLFFILALLEWIRPSPAPAEALATVRGHFAVLFAAIVLGVPAFWYLSRHGEVPTNIRASDEALREHLIRPDSHVAGNPNASLAVVEFGDFECPACGREEPVVEEVLKKYGTLIRFYFRQFPLEKVHQDALRAAEASECAADQGKFWEAEQKLYENQFDLSEPALERYAGELGLDAARFKQCLTSDAALARIRRDLDDGRAIGINATPTFFVGPKEMVGPIEISEFFDAIDRELVAQAGATTGVQAASSALPTTGGSSPGSSDPLTAVGSNPFASLQDADTACSANDGQREQADLIRTPEARALFEGAAKPLFVDVRAASQFSSGHIRGAINLPVDEFAPHLNMLPKDRTLVLYESGRGRGDDVCAAARAAGRVLLAHGFPHKQVKVYQDGMADWEKAGLPVDR
jgi:uncharacterized membrane protein/rhodanese-related sulfurtransferase